MDNASRAPLVWALAVVTCVLPIRSAATPLANAKTYDQAQFVFAGTVVRGGSNVAALAADASSIVVRVDRVYKGTPVFRDLAGREVTVITPAGASTPKTGTGAVFVTASYLFAENAAVREIAIEPLAPPDQISRRVVALDTAAAMNRLRTRLASSELVIVGRVVGEPRRAPVQRTVGEHDPQLRLADVAVSGVERGTVTAKTVSVLFASSTDERWLRAPKLTSGERAVFSLQRDRQVGAVLGVPSDILERAYTAYQPDDVRPLGALPTVRSVLLRSQLR
jgi:hypothetical protein